MLEPQAQLFFSANYFVNNVVCVVSASFGGLFLSPSLSHLLLLVVLFILALLGLGFSVILLALILALLLSFIINRSGSVPFSFKCLSFIAERFFVWASSTLLFFSLISAILMVKIEKSFVLTCID